MIKFAIFLAFLILLAKAEETIPNQYDLNWLQNFSQKYPYELCCIILIFYYFQQYRNGKHQNKFMVLNWTDYVMGYLKQNFAHVGVTKQSNGPLIDEEDSSTFKMYASGRLNCLFCLCTFKLQQRQDLLHKLFLNFIWGKKDQLIIDIPIDMQDTPVVFGILKKRQVKSMIEKIPELKSLGCKKYCIADLSDQFVVLGENQEICDFLIEKSVVKVLNTFDKKLESLIITDQKSSLNYPFALRATFNLPNNIPAQDSQLQDNFITMLKIVMYFVDRSTGIKISTANRQKSINARNIMHEQNSKEEKQKRIELLNQQKYEKQQQLMKTWSAEQKAAFEEKQKQKELKKRFQRKVQKA